MSIVYDTSCNALTIKSIKCYEDKYENSRWLQIRKYLKKGFMKVKLIYVKAD